MTIISGKYQPPKPTFIDRQPQGEPKIQNGKMVMWKVIPYDQDGIPYAATDDNEASFVITGVGYLRRAVWLSAIGFDPDIAFDYLNHWSESYETMIEPETWIYLVETLSSDLKTLNLVWFDGYQVCELDHDLQEEEQYSFMLPATPRERVAVQSVRVGIHFPSTNKPVRILDLLRPPTYAFQQTLKNTYPSEKQWKTLINASKQPTMLIDLTLVKTPLDKRS